MSFGLTESQQSLLVTILDKGIPSGEVIVYGSRAKGTHTNRSDIDLVVKNLPNASAQLIEDLRDDISESDFPFLADILCYESIKNHALIDHINRVGQVILSK